MTETKIGEVNGEEIVAGPAGGAGSKIPWYELIDARALEEVAAVFTHGAQKYQRDNWRAVPVEEHLRHLVRHAFRFLEPKQQYYCVPEEGLWFQVQQEELSHLACRAVMALAVFLQDPEVGTKVPKGLARQAEPKDWGEMLDKLGHEFDSEGRVVAKEGKSEIFQWAAEVQARRDSAWTGEDVDQAWPPPNSPERIPDEDTSFRAPRFAVEDGLVESAASESEHGEPPPCPSPQSQLRTYSLYDLGKFEMLESDYENRRSVGLWEDRDTARQALDGLVARGWARHV